MAALQLYSAAGESGLRNRLVHSLWLARPPLGLERVTLWPLGWILEDLDRNWNENGSLTSLVQTALMAALQLRSVAGENWLRNGFVHSPCLVQPLPGLEGDKCAIYKS